MSSTPTTIHRQRCLISSSFLLFVVLGCLTTTTSIVQGAAQPGDPWINEFHYDNAGTDRNEFVEVAAPRALDVSNYQLILYNGFYGRLYKEDAYYSLGSDFDVGATVNGITYYNLRVKPQNCSDLSSWCGLENGKDGFALAEFFTPTTGRVVEFLSYEGTFVAKDGPAANMSSHDVGVEQISTTPIGYSISKIGRGCHSDDFIWTLVNGTTPGNINVNQTVTCEVAFINEFHYTDTEDGIGQFVEVALDLKDPDDIGQYSVVLYSGVDGMPYDAVTLNEFEVGDTLEKEGDDNALLAGDEDGITFYHYTFPASGNTVGLDVGTPMVDSDGNEAMAPAGLALVIDDKIVLDFISYGGSFNATGGPAKGMTTFDVNVTETKETPVGSSIQLSGDGCDASDFTWIAVEASNVDIGRDDSLGETPGEINVGQTIDCSVDYELLNATATEAAAEAAEEAAEDDLIAEDDDFLGEDAVIISTTRQAVIHTEGRGKTKPIERPTL